MSDDSNDPIHIDFWSIVASASARLVEVEAFRRVLLSESAYREAPIEAVEWAENEIASAAATLRDAITDKIGAPQPRKVQR
jgi:hypothetical protein